MFTKFTGALKALLLVVLATVYAGCEPALQDTGTLRSVDTATLVESDLALAYDARTGTWEEAVFSVLSGDELLYDGHLYKVSVEGLVDRGSVDLWALYPGDAPFDAAFDDDTLPGGDEWVLVLGDGPESGHRRFGSVQPGERFAYFGRVHATRAAQDGVLEVRQTGEVLSEVAATFVRHAALLLEAELVLEDGSVSKVSATGGHPFYVPAEDTYRPLEELEVGTGLRIAGGGTAVVLAVHEVPGDVEVFNFEVSGQHNYFAGESGVAVHNAKYHTCNQRALLDLVRETTNRGRKPLPYSDFLIIQEWAMEYAFPGFRANAVDLGQRLNRRGVLDPPHFHMPGVGQHRIPISGCPR